MSQSQSQPRTLVSDVLLIVARELQSHPPALSRLCMIDKKTHSLLRHILYQHVNLSTTESIRSFCSAINSNERESAGRDVIALAVGEKDPIRRFLPSRLVISLAPALQAALLLMPNLQELSISATSAALSSTLHDLDPPFKLRSFSYFGNCSMPVIHFLMGQPTITKLEMWRNPSNSGHEAVQKLMVTEIPCLPRLEHLTVPLSVASYLVPSRPISTVVVVDWAHWGSEDQLDHLVGSTVPISSICVIKNFSYRLRSWYSIIQRLNTDHLCASLRVIKLEEFILVRPLFQCQTRSNILSRMDRI